MTSAELRQRTATFAVRVSGFAGPLLRRLETRHPAGQLLRASSSVAANYRAACRARSHTEFTAKLGLVLEEADESLYWLEYLRDGRFVLSATLIALIAEASELVAIFTTAASTAKAVEARDRASRRRRN